VSRATFGSLPWRPRSQHDLAAKSCPAHNFVNWTRILQIFHRNDHHIETMCRAQHLGWFYTLNFVWDITLTLQEVYLPVSKTYLGSITRFNRLLFSIDVNFPYHPRSFLFVISYSLWHAYASWKQVSWWPIHYSAILYFRMYLSIANLLAKFNNRTSFQFSNESQISTFNIMTTVVQNLII
jgi:hypothetical protein